MSTTALEDLEEALREAVLTWPRVREILLELQNDGVEELSNLLTESKAVANRQKLLLNSMSEARNRNKVKFALVSVVLAPFTMGISLLLMMMARRPIEAAIVDNHSHFTAGPRGKLENYVTLLNENIEAIRSQLKDMEEPMKALKKVVDLIRSHFDVNEAQATSMLNSFLTWERQWKINSTNAMSAIFTATLCLTTPPRADLPSEITNETFGNQTHVQRGIITATNTRIKIELDNAVRANAAFANELRDLISLLGRRISEEGELFAAFIGVFLIKNFVTAVIEEVAELTATFKTRPDIEKFDDALAKLNEIKTQIELCLNSIERTSTVDVTGGTELRRAPERDRLIVNNIAIISIARKLGRSGISTQLTRNANLTRDTVITSLRQGLEQLRGKPGMLSKYFSVFSPIEELVDMDPSSIRLVWYDGLTYPEIVLFNYYDRTALNEEIRGLLDKCILPFQLLVRTFFPLEESDCMGLCCIYRIRCKLCERAGEHFSYVGQTVDLAATLKQHEVLGSNEWPGDVEHEENPERNQHSQSHGQTAYHATQHASRSFVEIYEVDVCHFLNDYNEQHDDVHRRVRRDWQIYYQWLFRAIQTVSFEQLPPSNQIDLFG